MQSNPAEHVNEKAGYITSQVKIYRPKTLLLQRLSAGIDGKRNHSQNTANPN